MKNMILYYEGLKFFPDKNRDYNKAKTNKEQCDILVGMLENWNGKRYVFEYVYEKSHILFSWNLVIEYIIAIFALSSILIWWLIMPTIIIFFIKSAIKRELIIQIKTYFDFKKSLKLEDNYQVSPNIN